MGIDDEVKEIEEALEMIYVSLLPPRGRDESFEVTYARCMLAGQATRGIFRRHSYAAVEDYCKKKRFKSYSTEHKR